MSNSFQPYNNRGNAPFHFIVVDDKLLLQDLDCIQCIASLFLREHDLAEVSLSKNS